MPRKVFTAGEILTAANLNDVSDQSVMVFDDASARTTAIPTPVEGMTTYLKDTDLVEVFDGSNFVPVAIEPDPPAILQVVQTIKTDVFSTASNSYVSVTGASVSITPSNASSKILILGTMFVGNTGAGSGGSAFVRLAGGGTASYAASAVGSRVQAIGTPGSQFNTYFVGGANGFTSLAFLDSPATASAVTYNIELRRGLSGTAVLGRKGDDPDSASTGRFPTTIIVMEVAG